MVSLLFTLTIAQIQIPDYVVYYDLYQYDGVVQLTEPNDSIKGYFRLRGSTVSVNDYGEIFTASTKSVSIYRPGHGRTLIFRVEPLTNYYVLGVESTDRLVYIFVKEYLFIDGKFERNIYVHILWNGDFKQ